MGLHFTVTLQIERELWLCPGLWKSIFQGRPLTVELGRAVWKAGWPPAKAAADEWVILGEWAAKSQIFARVMIKPEPNDFSKTVWPSVPFLLYSLEWQILLCINLHRRVNAMFKSVSIVFSKINNKIHCLYPQRDANILRLVSFGYRKTYCYQCLYE